MAVRSVVTQPFELHRAIADAGDGVLAEAADAAGTWGADVGHRNHSIS